MNKILNLFLISLLLMPTVVRAGGGWPQAKGEGFFLLSQRFIAANGYYNNQGFITSSPNLSAYTTHFYGEYGITDKITGIMHTPFVTALSRDAGVDAFGNVFTADQAIGFGDVDLGLKYNFISKPFYLSAELNLGINSGDYYGGTTESLHLGDGDFSQLLKVYASKGFKYGIFATLFAGINNRTNGFSDEYHYGGELGIQQFGFTAIAKIYSRQSFFNEPRKDSQFPGIYSDNLEYFSYSFQLLYTYKDKFGVMVEQGSATSSRNIIASKSFTFGFFYKLKKPLPKHEPAMP
ncbi:MAG: hypothetical protein GQ574_13095 [Crocinitomix sp.]|nr:hypothetical protein [Crocinitomix sp.]